MKIDSRGFSSPTKKKGQQIQVMSHRNLPISKTEWFLTLWNMMVELAKNNIPVV